MTKEAFLPFVGSNICQSEKGFDDIKGKGNNNSTNVTNLMITYTPSRWLQDLNPLLWISCWPPCQRKKNATHNDVQKWLIYPSSKNGCAWYYFFPQVWVKVLAPHALEISTSTFFNALASKNTHGPLGLYRKYPCSLWVWSGIYIIAAGRTSIHGSNIRSRLILMATCGESTARRWSRTLRILGNFILDSCFGPNG